MTKSEHIELIEIVSKLEEVQKQLADAELLVEAQKLTVNEIICDLVRVGRPESDIIK